MSYRKISNQLAAAGFVNERGQLFNPKSIKAMLDQPAGSLLRRDECGVHAETGMRRFPPGGTRMSYCDQQRHAAQIATNCPTFQNAS